jgi:hypothetical protein
MTGRRQLTMHHPSALMILSRLPGNKCKLLLLFAWLPRKNRARTPHSAIPQFSGAGPDPAKALCHNSRVARENISL